MLGIEHEGFANNPAWYTEAQYQASALLTRYLCDKYGIPKDRNHIIAHGEHLNPAWRSWMAANWPEIDTTCNTHYDPGPNWDWTHYLALVAGRPAIRVATGAGGVLTLQWAAVAGQRYRVQIKSQLNAPVWQELAVVTAASDTASFEVSPGSEAGQRFYRLAVD